MKSAEVAVAVRITDINGNYPILGHIVAEVDEHLGLVPSAAKAFVEFCRSLRPDGRKYFVQTKHGPFPCVDTKDGATIRIAGCYPAEHLVPDGYRRLLRRGKM